MSDTDHKNLPIIVACSGGSPQGELADQIARRLQEKGLVHMLSLSGLTSNINESSQAAMAKQVILIDGCHSACVMQSASLRGYENCEHVDLIELGITKLGDAPSEAAVERGVKHISKLLLSKKNESTR